MVISKLGVLFKVLTPFDVRYLVLVERLARVLAYLDGYRITHL
jgi:hypothetical protein